MSSHCPLTLTHPHPPWHVDLISFAEPIPMGRNEDSFSQPPLVVSVVMWLSSGQWKASSRVVWYPFLFYCWTEGVMAGIWPWRSCGWWSNKVEGTEVSYGCRASLPTWTMFYRLLLYEREINSCLNPSIGPELLSAYWQQGISEKNSDVGEVCLWYSVGPLSESPFLLPLMPWVPLVLKESGRKELTYTTGWGNAQPER